MTWHPSIPAAEVHAKGSVGVEVDGLRLALFSLEGEIHATGNICTHAFALLTEGHVENGCVECPLHQGLFDIRSGKALSAPVTRDIATYDAKVEDGIVWIDTEARVPEVSDCPQKIASGSPDFRRLVIVGAGQAGAETARAARAHGFGGKITLLGEEAHPPYERPPLSKDLLLGQKTLAEAHVLTGDELAQMQVDLRLQACVTAIDRQARTVTLTDGEAVPYDMLVLATGAAARRIALPGDDRVTLHYLRDVADFVRLARRWHRPTAWR